MPVVESVRWRASVVCCSALLAVTAALAGPAQVAGKARVLDGDTVVVDGWRVRLKGVDAPELAMPGGIYAREVMREIVGIEGSLVCVLTGEKTRGREVGFCTRPDGLDVNREIIIRGAALACPRFSQRYLLDETADARVRLQRAPYCFTQ